MEPATRPELWIAGYPSFIGGADTECDHLIDLLTSNGWGVHLCPPRGYKKESNDPRMVESVAARGCTVHPFEYGIFKDKLVIAICNASLLEVLPAVVLAGRPRHVLWANCMTWTMKPELMCQELGLINQHIFQSTYQRTRLLPELRAVNSEVNIWEDYIPYFNTDRFTMREKSPSAYFGIGRVSRDDAGKYHPAHWKIYGQVTSPPEIPVKAYTLGFGEKATKQCGQPQDHCSFLDSMTWDVGGTTIDDFYNRIHVLIHLTGGSRENWPRCVLEAWANGVVPIVDNDFGCPEMITNGENGYLVNSPSEASFRASELAWNPGERESMVAKGFETLRNVHACESRAIGAWNSLYDSLFETKTETPM